MTIRYNPKEAEEEGFERVPPGRYLCQVKDAEEKFSAAGDPMVSMQWRRVDENFTLCWDNLVFSAKGRGIAHKKLKAMGLKIPEDGSEFEFEVADLIGLECWLTVVEKEYKGKKNLTPDFDAEGFGYEPSSVGAAPAGAVAPAPSKAIKIPMSKPSDEFDGSIPF